MIETTIQSTLGVNGELHLQLFEGFAPEGGKVTVQVVYKANRFKTQEAYREWVRTMAGSWQGEFELAPLLPLEGRHRL